MQFCHFLLCTFVAVCLIHVFSRSLSFEGSSLALMYSIAFDILQRLLTTFIEKLFTPKSFEGEFTLVGNVDGHGKKIIMPDGVQ